MSVSIYMLLAGPRWLGAISFCGISALGFLLSLLHQRSELTPGPANGDNPPAMLPTALPGLTSAELPQDVEQQVSRIEALARDATPRLTPNSSELQTMRDAVEQLMPTALRNYVALPREFREREPLVNGGTADQSLREQLATIEREVAQIRQRALHAQACEVLAHGNYLQGRFPTDAAAESLGLTSTESATPLERKSGSAT
jgi:hypothetical protein